MNQRDENPNARDTGRMSYHDRKLYERGILTAARSAGWQVDRNGWEYPVFDIQTGQPFPAKHWKNADSNAPDGQKYLWRPEKPAGAKYYAMPDLLKAIAAAFGVVYIAAGQPDTLAYIAAGLRNVFSWFDGEKSVPATLAADLRSWDVTRVIYVPDNDDTGRKSAVKVRDLLAGSGIDFEVLSLAAFEPKFDINKLWQHVRFDQAAFAAALASLPALDLPAPEAAPVQIARRTGNSGGRGRIDRERLKADVYAFLVNQWHWKKSGQGFIAGRNLARGDKNQSGGYHIASGTFRDFGNGTKEKLNLLEFAEYIGFRLDDYRTPAPERRPAKRDTQQTVMHNPLQPAPEAAPKPERPPAITIVQRDESPLWSYAVQGLPDSWRTAALNIFDPAETNFLLALIRAIKAGRVEPERLTIEMAESISLSESQVDRVLTRLAKRGLFIAYEGKCTRTHKTSVEEDGENTYRGFVRLFRLQTVNEVKRALMREIEPECKALHLASSKVLPSIRHFDVELNSADVKPVELAIDALRTEDDHRAESDYRADLARWEREINDLHSTPVPNVPTDDLRSELLRMYVEPGNRYSREELARFLGCSVNSLSDIRKKAKLQAIPQWEHEPLETITSAENLNLQVREAQKKQDGKVIQFNGEVTHKGSIKDPAFVAELQDAQRRGIALTMYLRVHSLYVEARETDQTDNTPPPDVENETDNTAPDAAQETAECESVPVIWRSFTGRKIRVALRRLGFHVNRYGDVTDSTGDELMLDEPPLPDVLRWIAARVLAHLPQNAANQNRQVMSIYDARQPA